MTKALAKSSNGHGGRRPNQTGRPPGKAAEKKYGTVLEVLKSDEMEGLTPIAVMLKNMKFYHDRAESLSDKLAELADKMTPEQLAAGGKELMRMLELINKVGDFRLKSQACAADAAPYAHPRLSAIAVKVDNGDSKKPTAITLDMTPRQAIDAYQESLQVIE